MTDHPRPPANLEGYVDVLGVDLTVELLMQLGGSEVYFAEDPKGKGMVERIVGREKAAALSGLSSSLSRRVPTGNRWCAQVLRSKGLPVAEIARRLRVTDTTVRSYLKSGSAKDVPDTRQLPLF